MMMMMMMIDRGGWSLCPRVPRQVLDIMSCRAATDDDDELIMLMATSGRSNLVRAKSLISAAPW